MNKWFRSLVFLLILVIVPSFQAHALTFDKLPQIQKSKQWLVEVGKPEFHKNSIQPKKGVYDTYSFTVKNIGKNMDSVNVQAFRNEPNSKTKFALFTNSLHGKILQSGQQLKFTAFPLAVKATELEITVTWKEKGIKRDSKETFVFTQN
ncbi:hypothetical protein HPT25_26470 [Bacillus sp. BRMEA1]|uniref:hypothetical protein n=1 Tax=Neobacillus endophyticus TaxID=2738405 RepID=UPI0015665C8F|nr:hypothetical protein [Neobacillus endophyticus]NRD80877.1 hypothetical protein [Neobacillus endophyticus]